MVIGYRDVHARSYRSLTICVLVLAGLFRIVAAWHWRGNLDDDRDVYRALGVGIVEGRGFSSPGTSNATAYRPPLYPLVLAATGGARSTLAVAVLNVLLGTATVAFVMAIGRRLRLGGTGVWLAGLLAAIDPLLLYYTSFPMTETVCTCLLTAWLWSLLHMQAAAGAAQLRWGAASGVLLGLTALCRPTVWACAVLLLGVWIAGWIFSRKRGLGVVAARREARSPDGAAGHVAGAVSIGAMAALLLAAGLTVAPWGIRNWRVIGRPVITTTHGGYTLLLGNNPAYYREVVSQPLGVVWDGSRGAGQQAWAADLQRQTEAAGLSGEVEVDGWMTSEAWRTIRGEPGMFARACLRRVVHFWSIVPNVRSDSGLPPFAVWSVGAYYVVLFTGFAVGLVCVGAGGVDRRDWLIPVVLIAGFAGVHVLYWSDARMRAPVTPEIGMLATCGATRFRDRERRFAQMTGDGRGP